MTEVDKKWMGRVRLSNGAVQKVYVEADNSNAARLMLEAQYGRGNVIYVGRE